MTRGAVRILNGVPFGNDEDDTPALAQREVGDLQVLFLHRLMRVHDERNDVGIFQGTDGLGGRHPLEPLLHLGLAAQACGIHEADLAPFPFPIDGNGIAGYPGLGPRQQALGLEQLVDERGLARVRAANDCQTDRAV